MLNFTPTTEAIQPIGASDHTGHTPPASIVTIEKVVAGGKGLGRVGSQVVFVSGALPGEKVAVGVGPKRRGVHQAEIREVLAPSPDRIEPPCSIAGDCGGCQFQHQTYQSQLIQKRMILEEALLRIGKLSIPKIPEVVPSPRPFHYRTTVRFVIFKQDNQFRLGFFRQGTRTPIHATHCLLLPKPAQALVAQLADRLSHQRTLPVYLESVEIRWSELLSQGLLIFRGVCRQMDQTAALAEIFGSLTGLVGMVFESTQASRDRGSPSSMILTGQNYLGERFHDLSLRIGYDSFLQANWPVYESLGQTLVEWCEDLTGHPLLELYAGVGALGLLLARKGAKVTLVEPNGQALSDARRSANLNHVGRCRFRRDAAETYLPGTQKGEYDGILVDPPRTGLTSGAIQELGRILVPRLFYISCDPATLARDLSRLCTMGYRIRRLQPFDMFPQTAHIETLVELNI